MSTCTPWFCVICKKTHSQKATTRREKEEAALGGAPAARGCPGQGDGRLLWGELPLRGAARLREEGGCFGGSSRCAGLPD